MKKILSILTAFFFCAAMTTYAETINYILVKTVYEDGRIVKPSGNVHRDFTFKGQYIRNEFEFSMASMGYGDGTNGYRFHSVENGRSVYYYWCSGTAGFVAKYRTSQPHWDYTKAIIVSSDKKTINVCEYDTSGNLKCTSVYKVPSAPGSSGFIE